MGFKDKCKKIFAPKSIALGLSATAIVGGAAAAIAQSAVNRNIGNPFVLVFTNGENKDANSDYRLLGRHQSGYINKNFNDKIRKPGFNSWETELGLMLDNSNPVVQAEQLNWLYYTLFFKNTRHDNSDQIWKASKDDYAKNVKDSTFDGIRIDCADATDSDVIGQTGQLLDDLYGRAKNDANSNDHLSFNEGYGPNDAINERKYFKNSSLNYDDSYYQNMTNNLLWYDDGNIPDLSKAKSSMTDWDNDQTTDDEVSSVDPNLTYSQNHDNFVSKIMDIARLWNPNFAFLNYVDKPDTEGSQANLLKKASGLYYSAMTSNYKTLGGKQISPKNQISLYADMLTNKDTVPVVFYGDIFESEKDYMSTPSAIAEPIMDILDARSKYVAGGQQRRSINNGSLVINVRFGDGYYEGKTKKDSKEWEHSKNSGIVTVYSNNKYVYDKDLKIYVGKNHAGQYYENLIDTDASDQESLGLTAGSAITKSGRNRNDVMGATTSDVLVIKPNTDQHVKVDEDGYIKINVQGTEKPFVDGYLSMWVPETNEVSNVYKTEAQAENMKSFEKSGKILNSNSALDSHVVFQDFAVTMPYSNDDPSKDAYAMLNKNAQKIADSGITDIWMAPPYSSPDDSDQQLEDWVARYGFGYMMNDRYNLGDTEKATTWKYGTADQLVEATDALHNTKSKITGRSIKTVLDFVPHQIIRGQEDEDVTFDMYNATGFAAPLYLTGTNITRKLKTRTSIENFQYKFGGLYLKTIKKLFPEMFSTPALSTGEILPDDVRITNWSAKYEITYPLEFGLPSNEALPSNNSNNNVVYNDLEKRY